MVKKTTYDRYIFSDKIFRSFLLTIGGILFIFGVITLIQPKWLAKLSKPGRKEEAQTCINDGNLIMYSANQNNSSENYEKALLNYRKALEIDSLNIDAKENMGIAYLYLNMLDEAKATFEKCLKTDTIFDYHTNIYLGDLYERKGDIEKALEYYLISAKKHPYPSYPLRKAGLFNIQLQNFDNAIKYLEQSIELEKSFESFYKSQLIEASYKAIKNNDTLNLKIINNELQKTDFTTDMKRYDKYIFKQTRKRSKDLGYAYMYLGTAYFNKYEFSEAAENYRISLRYCPEFADKIKNNLEFALQYAK